jgi:hypothetical protein
LITKETIDKINILLKRVMKTLFKNDFRQQVIIRDYQNTVHFHLKQRSNTTGKESCATKYIDNNENERSNEQSILEEIDVDVDELIDADEPSASILYFPSSYIKPMSNIIDDASR